MCYSLGDTAIEKIQTRAFEESNKVYVQRLYLSNLQISTIEENAFDVIKNDLLELHLDNNSISELPSKILHGITYLSIIDLSQNQLSTINSELFKESVNLKKINLSDNKIVLLPHDALYNVKKLEELNMRNNQLFVINQFYLQFQGNLKFIDLSRNKITSLHKELFQKLITLEHVNISYNSLNSLPDDLFSETSRLYTLDISHNKIESLSENILDKCPALLRLNMSNNIINSIDKNAFANSLEMEYLDFEANSLSNLPTNMFAAMEDLKVINFGNNMIDSLGVNQFQNNYNLEDVNFSTNNIKSLRYDVFPVQSGGNNIIVLDLSNNTELSLTGNVFQNMKNLQVLILKDTEIEFLQNDLFRNQTQLKRLILSNNNLNESTFTDDIFSNQTSMQYLDISANNISVLQSEMFEHLSNLNKSLNISYNKISNIENKTFEACELLNSLDLSHNLLTKIEKEMFVGLSQLRYLNLSHNMLYVISTGVFTNVRKLEHLDLRDNTITTIQSGALNELIGLKFLDMNNNQVKELNSDMLQGLLKLNHLALQGNNIESSDFPSYSFFYNAQNLENIDLSNNVMKSFSKEYVDDITNLKTLTLGFNPFECECPISWMRYDNRLTHHDITVCKRNDKYYYVMCYAFPTCLVPGKAPNIPILSQKHPLCQLDNAPDFFTTTTTSTLLTSIRVSSTESSRSTATVTPTANPPKVGSAQTDSLGTKNTLIIIAGVLGVCILAAILAIVVLLKRKTKDHVINDRAPPVQTITTNGRTQTSTAQRQVDLSNSFDNYKLPGSVNSTLNWRKNPSTTNFDNSNLAANEERTWKYETASEISTH